MALETSGKLHKIFPTETKGAKNFQVREFVIETDGQYPQYVKFQLTQDKCDMLDNYQEGQMIKVAFDLRGREWQGKYFTNLNAWKLESGGDGSSSMPPANQEFSSLDQSSSSPPPPSEPAPTATNQELDDLPF